MYIVRSEWLNIPLLIEALNLYNELTIYLVGPCDIKIPKHERLIIVGPVNHSLVFEFMKNADVLIMPFVVNELIKAVNPVKLYEYIYSCKPVISVYYAETEPFEPYIYLYQE